MCNIRYSSTSLMFCVAWSRAISRCRHPRFQLAGVAYFRPRRNNGRVRALVINNWPNKLPVLSAQCDCRMLLMMLIACLQHSGLTVIASQKTDSRYLLSHKITCAHCLKLKQILVNLEFTTNCFCASVLLIGRLEGQHSPAASHVFSQTYWGNNSTQGI